LIFQAKYNTNYESPGAQLDPEIQLNYDASVPSRVQALHDDSSRYQSDLKFREGDIINVLEAEDKDWWKGAIAGKEGLFPTKHVRSLPPTANELAKESITHVMAVYDFPPAKEEWLVLRKGDILQLAKPPLEQTLSGFKLESHGRSEVGLFYLHHVRKLRNGTVPVHPIKQPFNSSSLPRPLTSSGATSVPRRPTPPRSLLVVHSNNEYDMVENENRLAEKMLDDEQKARNPPYASKITQPQRKEATSDSESEPPIQQPSRQSHSPPRRTHTRYVCQDDDIVPVPPSPIRNIREAHALPKNSLAQHPEAPPIPLTKREERPSPMFGLAPVGQAGKKKKQKRVGFF